MKSNLRGGFLFASGIWQEITTNPTLLPLWYKKDRVLWVHSSLQHGYEAAGEEMFPWPWPRHWVLAEFLYYVLWCLKAACNGISAKQRMGVCKSEQWKKICQPVNSCECCSSEMPERIRGRAGGGVFEKENVNSALSVSRQLWFLLYLCLHL